MDNVFPRVIMSGSYNAFDEGWNGTGVYMFSGNYVSQTFKQPIYIGSSVNLKTRIVHNHIAWLNDNKHDNEPLQRSWNKYGQDNFTIWCLETCSPEITLEREQYYLDTYRPFADEFGGFNIAHHANAAMKGRKHSEETIEKMTGENNPNYGKERSIECRAKIAAANTGKKQSVETRKKQSNIKKSDPDNSQRLREIGWKNAKHFTVISPQGEIISTSNVRRFCREHDLKRRNFENLVKDKVTSCQGWKLYKPLDNN